MTDPATDARRALMDHYRLALAEAINTTLAERAKGRTPERAKEAVQSFHDNGMPYLRDAAILSREGPFDYATLLEPPYGDEEARREGKFPLARFPAFHALLAFVNDHPEVTPALFYDAYPMIGQVQIGLQIESATSLYFLRFGEVPSTARSRDLVLRFIFRGLFDKRLSLALLVPVAITQFDFDRFRLGPGCFLLRMSPRLQRNRWSDKAYGGNGHEAVLAAATHAFVLTGWGIDNSNHWATANALSQQTEEARERIEMLFAALRLETGIDTGYAQEIRLAHRWRMRHHLEAPEIYAVGARRYPERFDYFGWAREDVPMIGREQMTSVARTWRSIASNSDPRLRLALGRLNTAMMRQDAADAILDATIALEILLGDADNQAIGWKLRMRAAALAGLSGSSEAIEKMRRSVGELYALRSAIVHGATRRKRETAKAKDPEFGRRLAIDTLRTVMKAVIAAPRFLDPLAIDRELLLTILTEGPDAPAAETNRNSTIPPQTGRHRS